MSRFENKRSWIETCNGSICPKIQKTLEELKSDARSWEATCAGNSIFEVSNGVRTFVVDLARQSCICRKWDITGIPCPHGIAAIIKDKRQPESFVHPFFHKETYMRSYAAIINPIPDQTLWVHTESDAIMAPSLRRPPGRPKKARRKAVDEEKNPHLARRTHQSLKCSTCNEYGHNTRTCKGPIAANKPKAVVTSGESSRGRGRAGTSSESSRGRGRGDSARGRARGRGRSQARGRGRGRTQARGRGRNQGPTPTQESSMITYEHTRPTTEVDSAMMQRRSTTYGDVYFSTGVGSSRGGAAVQIGHSQSLSNMAPTQGSQVPTSSHNSGMTLDGYAAF
ncbi:hypothetical protein RHMOL_Rhmol06G0227900 [Rhododendron molle]|uniref:Uncharacterized protein n=1 Tax=Rhododendron molle TaxID=49168 RepID=A0ACC0NGB9_RHOML|nr:hypothetical protein RHMOL_Rhmol06G0227900 [Rhododendron molle]